MRLRKHYTIRYEEMIYEQIKKEKYRKNKARRKNRMGNIRINV
jgi:hypothetical protein